MRLLVLGGTAFVGRTVVTAAVERGWSVTTFNRGTGGWSHPEAEHILGDRTVHLDRLRHGRWDAVVDTWSGAPRVVHAAASLLAGRVARYAFISSRAVYATPMPSGMDETAATVTGSPDADTVAYGRDKRGAELAVAGAFGERAILARAGLILGPHEDLGRLPFWLLRIARGGPVLAPGPAGLPWRFIDVRDLVEWLLAAFEAGLSGPYNLVAPLGHATTRSVLEAAIEVTESDAELVWLEPATIVESGINRWDALPGWTPPDPDLAGLIWTDVSRAVASGLTCRPARETVADTWAWVLERGGTAPQHRDHPHALDRELELKVIAAHRAGSGDPTG
jgi:nucleoside-diphosphate-sugar epimerase